MKEKNFKAILKECFDHSFNMKLCARNIVSFYLNLKLNEVF